MTERNIETTTGDEAEMLMYGECMTERNIETTTHGRYLVESPGPGAPMLVAFHGYTDLAKNESDDCEALTVRIAGP